MAHVFVVTSHVEVEIENWSSMTLKVFTKESEAQAFAKVLKAQAEYNETIEVETIELIGD